MLANINRDSKKHPEPFTWLDVFPEHREAPEPQTDEQMFAAMQMWAAAANRLAEREGASGD
ncbi:MAG TPA: hypothetical protein VF167_02945 [Longimicrobiaceae bacterium]